ncbi:uncharacterized protein LOC125351384 isoform X2 [Perognathus longimembris pacificus]|uniref:uncharacterized protein LOC125351384 isoform X2 n=1 Tax=Perognathus longimembris pacificus TaxID=214514 RepID=UPI002018C716|nr:uncharacterized protein LOC125351384 isoform X2 [Perognathus longimembris pacificus]
MLLPHQDRCPRHLLSSVPSNPGSTRKLWALPLPGAHGVALVFEAEDWPLPTREPAPCAMVSAWRGSTAPPVSSKVNITGSNHAAQRSPPPSSSRAVGSKLPEYSWRCQHTRIFISVPRREMRTGVLSSVNCLLVDEWRSWVYKQCHEHYAAMKKGAGDPSSSGRRLCGDGSCSVSLSTWAQAPRSDPSPAGKEGRRR